VIIRKEHLLIRIAISGDRNVIMKEAEILKLIDFILAMKNHKKGIIEQLEPFQNN
jgi:hypothetical protein